METAAIDAPHDPDPVRVHKALNQLIAAVNDMAATRLASWPPALGEFDQSARNLAAYLALRQHDLRSLQRDLMVLGLSSLRRVESRVLPALDAVRAAVAAIAGDTPVGRPDAQRFLEGDARLAARRKAMLGEPAKKRPVGMLVTCPSAAAEDVDFMLGLARRGVEAIRINCAHDGVSEWQKMIDHVDAAHRETGHRLRILMDLGGPKIRTGEQILAPEGGRLNKGDRLALARPGCLEQVPKGCVFAAECTLANPVEAARPGHRVLYNDGKLLATVDEVHAWGLMAQVERCAPKGVRLKAEKGLNFPDTPFEVDALTPKDIEDLRFIATHADGIEYSFVQSPQDVVRLQDELAAIRDDWQRLWLVLKIETAQAVARLPEMLVQAASRQPTALMIARGDMAVEIGFERTAEMQEEILWLAEAAHTPVIWATQVLEQMVRKGTPARGEMTDAAAAARADCVMLNKGPFVFDAVDALDVLLRRMAEHQYKKTPTLRRLRSWSD